ncbi:hypothetical protein [Megasphaera sp.]|uniref:hypothetical protein n=1 Tax=Megasphaera sp. TaxID=2023260 RepID=UPI00257DBC0C|nr:hypothetical protein [Megasphaera sp.]
MAVTYGFYDSLNHDRLYNAQQMSAIFDGIINDGVFMSVGNQFHTVAGTGMQVIVKSGRAWFDSTWTLNDAEYPLSIDAADVLLTRIDAVVLEVNSEVATRANAIKVVKGTPASTPTKPTLTNTATIHQHALAYVTVAKNITAITNSMIEIVVGKTETPYVTAILQTTDITDLYNQWEDYFQTWFDTVRGTLDGDVALNLQNQITSLRRETLKNTTPPIIGLPASATPDDMFQALANTGELHVWRKTVKTAADIPAGYTVTDKYGVGSVISNSARITISYSDAVDVNDQGDVSLREPITTESYSVSGLNQLGATNPTFISGKFFTATTYVGVMYRKPSVSWSFGNGDEGTYFFGGFVVKGYAKIFAGTTDSYPVSINSNAYQEGDDAKPAGYVLGEVVSGSYLLGSANSGQNYYYKTATSLSVSDDGTLSMPSNAEQVNLVYSANGLTTDHIKSSFAGKFVQLSSTGADLYYNSLFKTTPSEILFIPNEAVITKGSDKCFYIDRYQPVTGYAAIPAGTVIKYLGRLGDKTRTQVINYVGTGIFGLDKPTVLNFNFPPKVFFVGTLNGYGNIAVSGGGWINTNNFPGSSAKPGSIKFEDKKVSMYAQTNSMYYDANSSYNYKGSKYIAVAIG